MEETTLKPQQFDSIRLKVASPEDILEWSNGEITKPETINYRTQKPEKDGLFCERIFGPSKDWECYCGKYKKIRYKGIVCDKCGVEVTRTIVRRERMGHITLQVPVSHIWFLRGVPSKIGLLLDLSIQNLERVIYFAEFIITKVDEEAKIQTMEMIKQEYKAKVKHIEAEAKAQVQDSKQKEGDEKSKTAEAKDINRQKDLKLKELEKAFTQAQAELKDLKNHRIISESMFQDLSLKYGHIFEASIGAEAVHGLLKEIDVEGSIKKFEAELRNAQGAKRDKLVRRVKLFKSLKRNGIRPEWMIMTELPVIPPDLRPMVPLDGGRFATSDLNDLYRRVINRNNRLRQLIELNAPEVICRNEKRMLQEAVDALIDNSARHGKTVTASTGQKRQLKSLADMLKGKQGRFRQNLLGKRTDYSGRSVIVVGPSLRMDQCGLPKKMALELFKPFVISRLIREGYVYNVRSAGRYIESEKPEVWAILEEIIEDSFVLLNRAPTLHRLGIQAFRPTLIEGKAIQIHPMVCSAFNADFDGDQMAVHVPLTDEAKKESEELMLSTHNLIKPATGKPIAKPDQDVVWGCYYMTFIKKMDASLDTVKELKRFSDFSEVLLAYGNEYISIQEPILVMRPSKLTIEPEPEKIKDLSDVYMITSAGRILFNEVIPSKLAFNNKNMDKQALGDLVHKALDNYTNEETAILLDALKRLGYKYLTRSGLSWGLNDLPDNPEKKKVIEEANGRVDEINDQYEQGLLTEKERYSQIVRTWTEVKERVTASAKKLVRPESSVISMVDSGARGSWSQLTQIIGMKGLVTNPAGEIIELPVKANFKEGFNVLEYFISTHGARKGLTDTALRTANAGYLTRRLIGVGQDVIVTEEECGTEDHIVWTKEESEETGNNLVKRVIGRYAAVDITPKGKRKPVVKAGEIISRAHGEELEGADLEQIAIRSVLTCVSPWGTCQRCYGYGPSFSKPVEMGTAVGIIAAQSIGEPGTQLTMRTFHTGGAAGIADITQGLPRVEELFEARSPKATNKAILAEKDGQVSIISGGKDENGKESNQKILKINYQDAEVTKYHFPKDKDELESMTVKAKDIQKVRRGALLFSYIDKKDGEERTIKSTNGGIIKIEKDHVSIEGDEARFKEYQLLVGLSPWVEDGAMVKKGEQLTDGHLELQQLYYLRGRTAVQKYLINEIQHIYASQGQDLNDNHVEIIAKQMFSRVFVKDGGDTEFISGEVIDRLTFEEKNREAKKKKKKEATGDELLLGITKSSLSTQSFLSAAAFQETSRVLINAAVSGQSDELRGLKENVIIGRLIPAGTGFKASKKKD